MAGWSILKDGSDEVKCSENKESDELVDVNVCPSNSDDDVNWSECDDKLRSLFDQVLMVLMRGVYGKNGIRPIPPLLGDGRPVDLFKLFCLVRDRGGFWAVSEEKLWGLIAEKFGFEYKWCTSIKVIYFKYLDELDQWLNRIAKDRILANGSYKCGGNLGLLSLELEKRLRDFSSDGKGLAKKGDEVGYGGICKHLDDSLHLADAEKSGVVHNGMVESFVDDDDNLGNNNKENTGEANQQAVDSSRKRKRDVFAEMLSWMIKTAKDPCHAGIEGSLGNSKWKEDNEKDLRSVILAVREARLHRKYTDSNDEQSPLNQKKNKMHPSMFEDNFLPNQNAADGLRCSKRLVSLVKTSCNCCKPGSVKQCKLESQSRSPAENGCRKQELASADSTTAKRVPVKVEDDPPVEKHVLIGPQFQAEVPIWTGVISESDPKWLGTQIWVPDPKEEKSQSQIERVGKGRAVSCSCRFPGSVECHRFHIAENRMRLRRELGMAFYHWKVDKMGEEVSLSWSAEDEKKFKQIIKLNKPRLGRAYFPKKRFTDLISYYYNVYLINRRSYQNRVLPKDIDSDDDEAELGTVGEPFGYSAVKFRRSEPEKCYLNEQVFDLD